MDGRPTEICEDCEDMLLEDGVPVELGEEVEVQPGIFVTFALESDATSPTSSGAECTDGEFVIIGATVRNASDDEFDASQLWSECYVGSSWREAVMDPALDLQGTLGYGYVPAGETVEFREGYAMHADDLPRATIGVYGDARTAVPYLLTSPEA
ncbi:hypothetical protein [Brevibacterium samyangense]|uniref:DUF4352 domain-containing protein n=1 Tax=Brevibacterium samyangense TaxID=366888 RepID=A0ABN2TBB4_9MICO